MKKLLYFLNVSRVEKNVKLYQSGIYIFAFCPCLMGDLFLSHFSIYFIIALQCISLLNVDKKNSK